MPAPTITSITPNSGLAVGDVFVKIVGTNFNLAAQGTVQVTFGGIPALRVGVASHTLILATAPSGDPDAGATPGAVDVVVTNRTPQPPGPDLLESATKVLGFTYKRPIIASPEDLSNHSVIALVTRTLVSEFQRAVLKNTAHDVHPDYANATEAALGQTQVAVSPSLKVLGPRIREDRDYTRPTPEYVDQGSGAWAETFPSKTISLTYDVVGVGRDYAEVANLWLELDRYFQHNDFLKALVTSSAFGQETVEYELEPQWEPRGDFRSHSTRQGIEQFTASFIVRGVTVSPDRIAWTVYEIGDTGQKIKTVQIPFVKPTPGPVENPEEELTLGG